MTNKYKYCRDCRHFERSWKYCSVTNYPVSVERRTEFDSISECGKEGRLWEPNWRLRLWWWLTGKKYE